MVGLAEKNLSGVGSANVEIKCREANGTLLLKSV